MNLRTPVPDLLNRFGATPYKLITKGFVIETNDIDLLKQFDHRATVDKLASFAPELHLRVIRESEASKSGDEVRTMCSESVSVLLVGTGTIIMVDREQHRVVGFVARNVSDKRFAHTYLPMALDHAYYERCVAAPNCPSTLQQSLQTSDKNDNAV